MANYHAPEESTEIVSKNVEILKKFGIKNIIEQKDVFDPELFFRLLSLTSVSELERMPQYKHALALSKTPSSQLLTYPVLMAHDIKGYQKIHVGRDQIAHVDFARKILRRLSEDSICPVPVITSEQINDLRNPNSKMSKSNPSGCLFLDDSPDEIRRKIKSAVTDEAGIKNLKTLYNEFVEGKEEDFPESYGKAKIVLSENILNKISK